MTRRSLLVVAALLCAPAVAKAEEPACPNRIGGDAAVDAIDARTRSRWLHSTLRSESTRANLWTWGWAGAGIAGAGANIAIGVNGDYDMRVDRFVGAGSSAALTASTLVMPLRVPDDGPEGDDCADVTRRELILQSLAEAETRKQGWFAHVLSLTGALASGVILGAGYGHWSSGVLQTAVGVAVSELKILTVPTAGARAFQNYRAGVLSTENRVGVTVSPTLGGLSMAMTF